MSCYAFRLAPCDLGDPGWGDPWFPHGAVLLPSLASMASGVSVFLPSCCLFGLWPYYDEMTQCCHLLHESAHELVASHSLGCWFLVLFLFCCGGFCLFVLFGCLCLVVAMTAYWTMYRSFTSSLLWPSIADGLEF